MLRKIISVIILCTLFLFSFGQNHNSVNSVKNPIQHKWTFYKPLNISADTTEFIINYDSADAEIWGSFYVPGQAQLMNMHYSTPADSSAGNYNVVNYFTVAFDSLVDADSMQYYSSTMVSGLSIDTIIIPVIQVNHSGNKDTLDVQLNAVDSYGYPLTTILKDTTIINEVIGDTNNSSYASYLKIPENYALASGTKFAVTVKYYGAKIDSCWFIYGYGSFIGNCDGGGPYTLAEPSNYSKVLDSTGSFVANSFVLYNRYKSAGLYPTANGAMFYYNCDSDTVFDPGTDGASNFQNINVYAMVTTFPLGINQLNTNGFYVSQNFPNPFSKSSQINYNITSPSDVVFTVYDVTGRVLINSIYDKVIPGQHSINLNAEQFTPGLYFYTFNVNGKLITKKMVITR
ncbi:MAG: T9SS type A sorting domain-containing protein [Bacteroidia bacterium]